MAHPAAEIKAHCADLEQTPARQAVGSGCYLPSAWPRRASQANLRRCLICDEPAHACSRSRNHPVEQVVSGGKMIDDWFARD
ncbi:MAG: citrate lyase holo-[acyl-carrier protein] synthase [Escherichia coli]